MEWIPYWKKDHATNIPSLKLFNFPILLQGRLWRKQCPRLPMWVLACLEAPLEPGYLKARKKATWTTNILQKDLRENFTAAERASEQQHNQGSRRTCLEGRTNSQIGHFRVLLCLCFKPSLSAKPFLWKLAPPAFSFSCKSKSFS